MRQTAPIGSDADTRTRFSFSFHVCFIDQSETSLFCCAKIFFQFVLCKEVVQDTFVLACVPNMLPHTKFMILICLRLAATTCGAAATETAMPGWSCNGFVDIAPNCGLLIGSRIHWERQVFAQVVLTQLRCSKLPTTEETSSQLVGATCGRSR